MIDEHRGPLVIEINAHPGLAIQLANGVGLGRILKQRSALDLAPMNNRELPEEKKVS
jgi:hypothetical protein